ncbi:MAG: glucosamine-6-phosphate deaminase [Candidatus Omnitrophica bacterium]|nr:glucosamine-6-phosphate deaminase [Candidatus Omnitrophota bacterium]
MQVLIRANYEEMSKEAARYVSSEMRKKVKFVLGLATGSTPLGLYKELIRMHKEEGLDFENVTTFNLDEYYGLSPTHEQSYSYFMWENLFKHVNIKKENVHIPDGMAKDVEKFCEEYEHMIKEAGGIDLQVLGIGSDGHIAFNEPLSSLGSRTRLKTLTQQTIEDNARFFENKDEVPRYAITMGVGTVFEAHKCILLASSHSKADVIAKAIEGPVAAYITASAMQLHRDTIVVLDEGAAAELKRKDYYRYVDKMVKEFNK